MKMMVVCIGGIEVGTCLYSFIIVFKVITLTHIKAAADSG